MAPWRYSLREEAIIPEPTGPAVRVTFPLWTQLGALFGGLYGLVIASYGVWDWSAVTQDDEARRASEMRTLGAVVAAGIDADAFATFRHESARRLPAFAGVVDALRKSIEGSSTVTWAGTCARDENGHWKYVVDGAQTAPYPVGFPIFDAVAERDRAWESLDIQYVQGLVDDSGRWNTVLVPIRGTDGAVVGLVELSSDADRISLVQTGRLRRTVVQFALVVTAGLLASFLFGRLLARHLGTLVIAARHVTAGRLDTRVDIHSRDEIGVLAATFNSMVEGLREREFIRDTFGRFVNRDVVAGILEDHGRLSLGGETRVVSVLMSDLRGFTALSDELGPERMVALLNRYLARMTRVIETYDGNIAELLGDGMVVLFGAPVTRPDDPRRVVACAVAMHQELALFNAEESRRLQMGIGIDTGTVVAGNIGDERHMKYGVVGAAINVAARLEGFTLGNQVLISQATLDAIAKLSDGGPAPQVELPLEFRTKGRRELVRAYPVRAVGDARMPEDGASVRVEVHLSGTVWRVEAKVVDAVAHAVEIVSLEPELVTVVASVSFTARESVKLAIDLEGRVLQDLYGAVEDATAARVVIRLTSMPDDARLSLERYLSERAGEATGPRLA